MVSQIILSKTDFSLLSEILKRKPSGFSENNLKSLARELQSAKVLENSEMPEDVIKVNSEVKVFIHGEKAERILTLVKPNEADIVKNRVSVLAPLGIALIGYKKGDTVNWEVPGGVKSFKIVDVKNKLRK